MPLTVGELEAVLRIRDDATQQLQQFSTRSVTALRAIDRGLTTIGAGIVGVIGIPLAASAKAAISFESAFANVVKTVNGLDVDKFGRLNPLAAKLKDEIRALSLEIPITANELAKIAALGGQLGISAQGLKGFTETVAKLSVAVDGIHGETAAAALAQISKVAGVAEGDIGKMASALVHLGNETVATEGAILGIAQRLVGAGTTAGLTADQIFGVAAAMANLGVRTEVGGSAMSRVLSIMSRAAATGGDAAKQFAVFTGAVDAGIKSGKQFADVFNNDPTRALKAFFEGLGEAKKQGQNLNLVLDQMEIKDVRLRDVILKLAQAHGELGRTLDIAKDGFFGIDRNAEEARKKFATLENQAKLLRNQLVDVGIEFGNAIIPVLRQFVTAATPVVKMLADLAKWFTSLPESVQKTVIVLGLGAGLAGVLVILGGKAVGAAANLMEVAVALRAIAVAEAAAGGGVLTATLAKLGAGLAGLKTAAVAGAAGLAGVTAGGLGLVAAYDQIERARDRLFKSFIEGSKGLPDFTRGADGAADFRDAIDKVAEATQGLVPKLANVKPVIDDGGEAAAKASEEFKKLKETMDGLSGKASVDAVEQFVNALTKLGGGDPVKGVRLIDPDQAQQSIELIDKAVAAFNRLGPASSGMSATQVTELQKVRTALIGVGDQLSIMKDQSQNVGQVLGDAFGMAGDGAGVFVGKMNTVQKEIDEIRRKVGLLVATRGLSEEFKKWATSASNLAKELKEIEKEAAAADPALRGLYAALRQSRIDEWTAEFGEAVGKVKEFQGVINVVAALSPQLARAVGLVPPEMEKGAAATKEWKSSLQDLSQAFAALAQSGGGLGDFGKFAGQVVGSIDVALQGFNKLREGLKEFAKGAKADLSKAFSDVASGVLAGVAGIAQATDPSQGINKALVSGGLTGAAFGATIAGFIAKGSVSAGIWGAVAGAIIGIVVAYWRGAEVRGIMRDVGRQWGVDISQGLAEKIKVDTKKFSDESGPRGGAKAGDSGIDFTKRELATLLNLTSIIEEAVGGLNDLTFDTFNSKIRDVWNALQDGAFDAEDAFEAFGDVFRANLDKLNDANFDKLLANFNNLFEAVKQGTVTTEQALRFLAENFDAFAARVVASGKLASNEFLNLLKLARESGLESPEVSAFVGGRNAVVGGGLVDLLGPISKAGEKIGQAIKDARAAVETLEKDGKKGTTEYGAALQRLNELLAQQGVEAKLVAGDLENIGTIALASFGNAIRSGVSFIDAINQIGPALDAIIAAQQNFGIEGDNAALKQLIRFRELANTFPELIKAAGALDVTLLALQHSGGLTVDALIAMRDQGLRTFNRLIDAGFTENEALASMGKFLKNLKDAHERLGVPIDQNTQRLIDQAEKLGLLDDTGDPTINALKEGFKEVTSAIDFLTLALTGAVREVGNLGDSLKDIPDKVGPVVIPVEIDWPEDHELPPEWQSGVGRGESPSPGEAAGTGSQTVVDPNMVVRNGAAAAESNAVYATAMAGRRQSITMVVDGQVVGRLAARYLPDEVELNLGSR